MLVGQVHCACPAGTLTAGGQELRGEALGFRAWLAWAACWPPLDQAEEVVALDGDGAISLAVLARLNAAVAILQVYGPHLAIDVKVVHTTHPFDEAWVGGYVLGD